MTAFFRPRRGKKSTAESQNIVLKRGEVFFESPTGGVGTGQGRIKVGDGTTAYTSLPYFLNTDNFVTDISTATVTFTETSETSNATLLSRIITGAGLNTIVASVKNLLYNLDNDITTMQQNFQAGVDAVYDACVAKGSTPASHSLSDVVAGIMAIQASLPTQTKSCTPSTSAQTIEPDSGYLLSSVSVGAISTQEKTVTGSRSAQTVTPDSGKYLSKVTINKYPDASGTYTASSRGASLDMGATNNYRYVNTNSVPNTNSGTYTYASGSTGGTVDMGSTNSYRYVNASNVYAKGKADLSISGKYVFHVEVGNKWGIYLYFQASVSNGKLTFTPRSDNYIVASINTALYSGWFQPRKNDATGAYAIESASY